MRKVRRLTRYEEIQYIKKAIQKNEYLGRGSSRAVYGLDDTTVIKVASDKGGRIQNHQELKFYKEHPRLCMDIYACGTNILVCERCEQCFDTNYIGDAIGDWCCDDDIDTCMLESVINQSLSNIFVESCNDNNIDTSDFIDDALRVVVNAQLLIGFTADNCQIGYGVASGKVKLYDFGYEPSKDCNCEDENWTQIGNINYYLAKCGKIGFLKLLSVCLKGNSNGSCFYKCCEKLEKNSKSHSWDSKFEGLEKYIGDEEYED